MDTRFNEFVYDTIKRVFDVVSCTIGLVVLSPILLCTAIAIKLEDGGPVIFAQERCTKGCKTFKMYKFRSMVVDAEEQRGTLEKHNESDGPVFKIKDDPRVTKVGKFIRKTSIDELPQLVNVIKGDMSVVGPRPPLLKEVHSYTAVQMRRLSVKTGLTCIWQCSGRSNVSFDKWMEMDLEYIDKRCILLDLKLILKTIYTVLFMHGAY